MSLFDNGWKLLGWEPVWSLPEPSPLKSPPAIPRGFKHKSFMEPPGLANSPYRTHIIWPRLHRWNDYRENMTVIDRYEDEYYAWVDEERKNYLASLSIAQRNNTFENTRSYERRQMVLAHRSQPPPTPDKLEWRGQGLPSEGEMQREMVRNQAIRQQAFSEGRSELSVARDWADRERKEAIERDKYTL